MVHGFVGPLLGSLGPLGAMVPWNDVVVVVVVYAFVGEAVSVVARVGKLLVFKLAENPVLENMAFCLRSSMIFWHGLLLEQLLDDEIV